ncbi:MAG TPA: tetraacyldisaccharide 4'-kinase [Terriglobales bacterium]|jgi:tetraacyldisaccharide 4'-kinase|nr:tetraacyldisaccharide 4'-kinase [Terriglobales bacterium]
MNPLANLFGAAVAVRNALYDSGVFPSRRLQRPVVSIGNLSVGGSGKTPFVMTLGELLKTRDIRFDVLSRGYGRETRGISIVDPGGLPQQFGDEPLLIARRLGVPVIIGEDRHAAGVLAENRFDSRLHLLDDGFQHRSLARDFDVLLVTPDDARDRLLPAGRLREPLSAVRRADAIVLTGGASAENFPLDGKLVWRARRGILPHNVPPRPVAFCGIARPQNFLLQLRTAGVEVAAEAVFRDHYRYNEKDIRELIALREQSGAGGFVTTEKDAVNLGGYFSALEPLTVVPVKMDIADADGAVETILNTVAARRGQPL